MATEAADSATELFSIGDVADATGISVDTIRVWERRYGRPVPVRLPSGHRRYTADHIRWMRRVAEALSRGQRPSRVVRLEESELDDLLAPEIPDEDGSRRIEELLAFVAANRGENMIRSLEADAAELGVRKLLVSRIAPLVIAVGRAWADGEIEIRHEHFASHLLTDFMVGLRLSIEENEDGPVVLLTTLSGEPHGLGLHMASIVAQFAGTRARVLGVDTPNDEIVRAAEECGAAAVAVSVSLATGGVQTDRVLRDLRALLPEEIELFVGGGGARGVRRGPRGIRYAAGLDELERLLRELA